MIEISPCLCVDMERSILLAVEDPCMSGETPVCDLNISECVLEICNDGDVNVHAKCFHGF
jgi:hypothetical protein